MGEEAMMAQASVAIPPTCHSHSLALVALPASKAQAVRAVGRIVDLRQRAADMRMIRQVWLGSLVASRQAPTHISHCAI
jgi:hypothetical protein